MGIKKIDIRNSSIYFEDSYCFNCKDYYDYIVDLIIKIIKHNEFNIDVAIVIDIDLQLGQSHKKVIKIGINFEHTLVKEGGRDSKNSPIGNIKIESSNEYYLVRINNYEKLNKNDIIIDYSNTNIINIYESHLYDDFYSKMIYVSPNLYSYFEMINKRKIEILTTFINTEEPRRKKLIENIKKLNIIYRNINNCFDKKQLNRIYSKTKILINIHQTDHHCTLEELRVLPALSNGIIVICEDSPLKNNIPYSKYIIWTSYDDMIETIKKVNNNYDFYYNKIFGHTDLKELLDDMIVENYNKILEKIKYCII